MASLNNDPTLQQALHHIRETDWFDLWAKLSRLQEAAFARQNQDKGQDFWKGRAKKFDKMVDQRWAKPDSSRNFLVATLKSHPGSTLLDIGSGTGKWALLAAPHAAGVTALEPSEAMQAVLREKIEAAGIQNIDIRDTAWPNPDIEPHDWVLASHSMYGVADFQAFVRQMEQTAKKGCILVLRAPFHDSIMARAARRVLGHSYDSPNFQVAYNCLLAMDIYAHVIMEDPGNWPAWTHDSLEAALDETLNRLGLPPAGGETCEHTPFLKTLLAENLTRDKEKWVWPAGNQSALVHWRVDL